jgi:hypothetical protein
MIHFCEMDKFKNEKPGVFFFGGGCCMQKSLAAICLLILVPLF